MTDPPKTPTLTVQGGPLHGHEFVLPGRVEEVLVGSDPGCAFVIELPGVSPMHARVWFDLEGAKVFDTRSPRGVYLNDDKVEGEAPLRDGDILWLGPPGEDDSVMIRCSLPAVEAGAVVGDVVAPEMWGDAAATDDAGAAPADDPLLDMAPEAAPEADAFLIDESASAAPAEPDMGGFEMDPGAPAFEEPAAEAPSGVLDEMPGFEVEAPSMEAEADAAAFAVPAAAAVPDDMAFEVPAADASAEAPEAPASDAFVFETEQPFAVEEPPPPADDSFQLEAAHEAPPTGIGVSAPEEEPTDAPLIEEPAAAAPAPPPAPSAVIDNRPAAASPAPSASAPRTAASEMRKERAAEKAAAAATPRPSPAIPSPRPPAGRPASKSGGLPVKLIGGAVAALVVLGGVGFAAMRMMSAPRLASVSPARVAPGRPLELQGAHFGADAAANTVTVGDKTAKVVKASDTAITIEMPDVATTPGKDATFPVKVEVGGRETAAVNVAVFAAPLLHGLSPTVAMPGEEVSIAGTGFGPGAKVRFGTIDAPATDVSPNALKTKVPDLQGAPGTTFPVAVVLGADASNALSLMLGRLPLVISVDPKSAMPGDVLTIAGRGFAARATENQVTIGGKKALVAGASDTELKVLVPWMAAAESAPVEIHVPTTPNVGQTAVAVAAAPDPVDFRFAAEPYEDAPGHDHALVGTALGPAFVVSAAGNRSAGERAAEAVRRLNAAAGPLKASAGEDIQARSLDANPVLTLVSKPDALLDVAAEDASAYDEDWTQLGGKGGPVTRARLGIWWSASARDLVKLIIRGEKPAAAEELAPEGKTLGAVYDAAKKSGQPGLPLSVVQGLKGPVKEGLKLMALRVPASVTGPAEGAAAGGAAAASIPPLKLEGDWKGTQDDPEGRTFITVAFTAKGGTMTYERALSLSFPLNAVEPRKDGVNFRFQTGAVTRHYVGRWDGEKISGAISTDPAGKNPIGTFELTRGR